MEGRLITLFPVRLLTPWLFLAMLIVEAGEIKETGYLELFRKVNWKLFIVVFSGV